MGQDEDRRKIVQIIREEFPDATITLFGSRARGDHYQHSDYDIAIISENIEDKDKAYRNVSKPLHEAVQASFDLVFYTPDEYSRGKDGFLPELIERERVELSA